MPNRKERKRLQKQAATRHNAAQQRLQERSTGVIAAGRPEKIPNVVAALPGACVDDLSHSEITEAKASICTSSEEIFGDFRKTDSVDVPGNDLDDLNLADERTHMGTMEEEPGRCNSSMEAFSHGDDADDFNLADELTHMGTMEGEPGRCNSSMEEVWHQTDSADVPGDDIDDLNLADGFGHAAKTDSPDVETCDEFEAPSSSSPSTPKCEEGHEEEVKEEELLESCDAIECLICMEEIGDERPLADITSWDLENHTNVSPDCRVVAHVCGECLVDYVSMYEQDPEKEGGFPCPLCCVPLREPSGENIARKIARNTCANIEKSSEKFQTDVASFMDFMAYGSGNRSLARHKLGELEKFARAERESFNAVPKTMSSQTWYVNARFVQHQNYDRYRQARVRYREVFPARPTARVGDAVVSTNP
jgi:hypothetical protein